LARKPLLNELKEEINYLFKEKKDGSSLKIVGK